MRKIKVLILLASTFLVISCAKAQTQISTATRTNTPIPSTSTFTPTATKTTEPTATPVPPTTTEEGFLLPLPYGDPLANWNGIPIMEGAINGEEIDGDAYVFTIMASMEEILAFYNDQLPRLGFPMFAIGEEAPDYSLLFFKCDSGMLTLSILIVDEEISLYYVMIVQG